jgi:hypothetical protein
MEKVKSNVSSAKEVFIARTKECKSGIKYTFYKRVILGYEPHNQLNRYGRRKMNKKRY